MGRAWILFVGIGVVLGVNELVSSAGDAHVAFACFGFALVVLVLCMYPDKLPAMMGVIPIGVFSASGLWEHATYYPMGVFGALVTLLVFGIVMHRIVFGAPKPDD